MDIVYVWTAWGIMLGVVLVFAFLGASYVDLRIRRERRRNAIREVAQR